MNEFKPRNGLIILTETAATVPYLDANKKLVSSAVTPTTLTYLDATSSIQTQLDAKASASSVTDHLNDTTDAHDASAISSVAAGNLSATNVQTALDELQTDIDTRAPSNSPTLVTPSTDIITLDGQGSTPSNPSAGNYKVYVKDSTQKLTVLDSTGAETTVGTGSGGGSTPNYIASPDGTAIGDWVTYDDGASSSPVDGTGGSPGATFAVSTSSTMRSTSNFLFTHDAADRQGEGFSYLMAIDPSDRGKVLRLSFDYLVASGTYADDGMAVWFYDVTNAALIQPAPYLIKNSSLIERFNCEVQVPSSCASLRVIFHVTTTTATAYTIRFDDFNFGPQAKLYGSPITDWIPFTPTGAWVSNTTYTGWYKREGDTAEFVMRATTSGSPTAADLTFVLPFTIDTTKFTSTEEHQIFGVAHARNSATASHKQLSVRYFTSNSVKIDVGAVTTHAGTVYPVDVGPVTNTVPFTFGASDYVECHFRVPIVGWSSSVVMSSDADTRAVAATMYRTSSNQTISSASETLVQLNAASPDTVGGANISTYRYTVQVPGNYAVSAVVRASSLTANESLTVRLKQSGTSIIVINEDMSNAGTASSITVPTRIVSATAGQYFELYVQSASDTSYDIVGTADSFTYMSIQRISGPSQIAASEVVAGDWYRNGSTTYNSNAARQQILIDTANLDSHSMLSSNTVVIQTPGMYEISAQAYFSGANIVSGGLYTVFVSKTTLGGTILAGAESRAAAAGAVTTCITTGIRSLVAGDVLYLGVSSNQNHSASTITIDGSTSYLTKISVKRLGGV